MNRLRFSYLVLGVCAALLVYGLVDASGRTAALFVDAREATGFVDASVAFPKTPTVAPATEGPQVTVTAQRTQTPERTSSPQPTGTPERTMSPRRTATPESAASPVRTVAGERTQPSEQTHEPEQTAAPATFEPEVTNQPDETNLPEETAALTRTPASVSTEAAEQSTTVVAESPSPESTRAEVPTVAATHEAAASATIEPQATTAPNSCEEGHASIALGRATSYSGPGPFTVRMAVSNAGESSISDIVLAFSVTSGAEHLDEAVFGNGQLWWPHGEPEAGVLYAIPELSGAEPTTVTLTGTLGPTWSDGSTVVLRVAVVGPQCAAGGAETILTLGYAGTPGPSTESAGAATTPVVTPSVTATPIGGATPVQTVLGISAAPPQTAASATAAALTQTLPDAGGGSGRTGSRTWLLIGGLSIALLCFIGGAIVGNRWFPDRR